MGGALTTEQRTRIASVPVGYADGYPRALTNKRSGVDQGASCTGFGYCLYGLDYAGCDPDTGCVEQERGDPLIGEDRKGNTVFVEEIAGWAGTIPYELLCGISKRVPRVYLGTGK